MSTPATNPAPAGDAQAWVSLENAAWALQLSRQGLWHRLQELHVEILRIAHDGRRISAISRDDLQLLARSEAEARPAAPRDEPVCASKPPPPDDAGLGSAPAAVSRSLWQQLRELERRSDQSEFELRVSRVQLADTRERAGRAEDALRAVRSDLEAERSELDELRQLQEPLKAEIARLMARLDLELEHSSSLERQMNRLVEVEQARERYCDRLEQRLHAPRRYARGA